MELARKIELLNQEINLREKKVSEHESDLQLLEQLKAEIEKVEKRVNETNVEPIKNEIIELKEWKEELCQSTISLEMPSTI